MDKKQAEKKLEKKKVVGKVGSRKKPSKKRIEKITINNMPTGNKPNTKKERMTTTFAPDVKVQINSTTQEPKRKDSRQAKIERLEAEVNLLATERSSLHSIIGGLKSENNDLKDEIQEMKEIISKKLDELDNAIFRSLMQGCPHKVEAARLERWLPILAGILFGYAVLNIVLGFYGI